ncbi:polyhydroxyalkanoic acid inclusion protein PhaP [Priestia filamentosa]|uniref:Polyhydroxyalkanoic acid inclusion protein PhaP n=1 Tax=Priestia filamentosa TaxID=1402861 RepID=A0A1X7EZF8_9BACI|nr:polyhydroxyalkanoic acid inclusion protein PhaP [Priestia filamentosa]AKO91460.1 polyhydroxyalkanoic acid inclusion protein PhaP [Priestia filamentosa]MDT3761549.1 polyhydroxyalkanoic acid inclusion protein PhaP [Priestia filamentosa]OXS67654.1 polyhydroxyalkanoic acid inclusion protein PhaP [Priestia filamentosa]RJS65141.1 polyhydroxyalkanoic acid inclusion protein PhaP [Priestia filamentosa]WCM16656.1 polyhydroxyalkanoic acid inclusion protein PhaP [Priestia filamentosa]
MANVKYDAVIDMMWDQWSKGFNSLLEGSKNFEEWTLKALSGQKQFVEKAMEQVEQTDEQWQQELHEVQAQTVENIRKTAGESVAQSYDQWIQRVNEAMVKMKQLSSEQQKAGYNFIKQAQEQYEASVQQFVNEHHKLRIEMQSASENYMDQLKSFQKTFLQSIEPYTVVK